FGMGLVDPDTVVAAFEDLGPAIVDCPRGCTHTEDSPGCALDAWVAAGKAGDAGPQRLASLRRLLRNRSETEDFDQSSRKGSTHAAQHTPSGLPGRSQPGAGDRRRRRWSDHGPLPSR